MTAVAVDGVLLVDKPPGITSTRALALSRRALSAPKAGHTGTLDPFATGLLPLVFGEATKFSRFLLESDKAYLATLCLGATTATGDTESPVIQQAPVSCSIGEVERVLREITGTSLQTPPMHSAVRVGGQRLYDLARQGLEVDRPARQIEVEFVDLVEFCGEKLVISVKCSKGTYVRTLAQTIGERLGCGAYLTGLRRTAAGGFRLEDAVDPDALQAMGVEVARARLLPTEVLVAGLPRIELDEAAAWAIRNGQVLPAGPQAAPGEHALFGPDSRFLGVGGVAAGRLSVVRLLQTGHSG